MGGRDRQISEFEASLVYKVSSRTARATQRNPVLKKQTNKQTKKTKEQQSFRQQNKSSHELTCGEIVGRNTENTDRIENLV